MVGLHKTRPGGWGISIWIISKKVDIDEGFKGSSKIDIAEIDRMLKALIKLLENKPLDPGILGPFLPTHSEKNQFK